MVSIVRCVNLQGDDAKSHWMAAVEPAGGKEFVVLRAGDANFCRVFLGKPKMSMGAMQLLHTMQATRTKCTLDAVTSLSDRSTSLFDDICITPAAKKKARSDAKQCTLPSFIAVELPGCEDVLPLTLNVVPSLDAKKVLTIELLQENVDFIRKALLAADTIEVVIGDFCFSAGSRLVKVENGSVRWRPERKAWMAWRNRVNGGVQSPAKTFKVSDDTDPLAMQRTLEAAEHWVVFGEEPRSKEPASAAPHDLHDDVRDVAVESSTVQHDHASSDEGFDTRRQG